MAGASNAEDFVIRLHEQISAPARVAESALAQLEARIHAQQRAVASLEGQLAGAAAKLQIASQGTNGVVNVEAVQRQQRAVADLQQKLDDARAGLDKLSGARGMAEQVTTMQRARQAIESAAAGVGELEAQMQLLQASGRASQASVDALTAAIARQRAAVAGAQQNFVRLGGSSRDAVTAAGGVNTVARAAGAAKVNLGELGEAFGRLGGPIGTAGAQLGGLGQAFTKLGALGPVGIIVAITAAVVALTVALVAGAVAATRWAIGLADAARNQALALAGLAASHAALGQIADILPRVQAGTGLASEEIQRMAADLAKANVSAENMEGALTALATAKAGGATAAFVEKLQKALVATGKVPPELAAQMSRFEEIARKKMLSLDGQSERLKKNFGGLFSGLKIDPFLEKLSTLVGLFDKNTASGQAVAVVMERIFQPLIDGATAAIPRIERAFIVVMIWALKAYVAVTKFFRTPQGDAVLTGLKAVAAILAVIGAAVLTALVVPFVMAFGTVAAVVAAIVGFVAGLQLQWNAMSGYAAAAWASVQAAAQGAIAWLQGVSLADIGRNIMTSLANGIRANAAAVVEAVASAVTGAIGAAESLLKIGSPSRVFHQIGHQTAQGMAGGVEEGTPMVERSVADMVAPPAVAASGGAGKSMTFHFENCVFGEGLDESKLEAWLVGIFQRNSLAVEPG